MLIRNGVVLGKAMRDEDLSTDELMAALRQHGVLRPDQVERSLRERFPDVPFRRQEGPAVRDHTAPFVDFANRVIDWAGMLDASRSWPRDQRLLVLTAYEMAFDTPGEVARAMSEPVTLQDVVRHLDDDEVERIRVAMQIRRGRLEPEEGLTRLA